MTLLQPHSQRRGVRSLILAAGLLALPSLAAAQQAPSLIESYSRVAALLDYMTGYIGEVLLACAAKSVLT